MENANQPITTKTCKNCGAEKTLDQFDKQKDCKLGVKNYCKECYKVINAERYNRKTNEIIKQTRLYQYAHAEEYKIYQREYHRKLKEKIDKTLKSV